MSDWMRTGTEEQHRRDVEKGGSAQCRVCGCTEWNACIDMDTLACCQWIEPDLCSACAGAPADAA